MIVEARNQRRIWSLIPDTKYYNNTMGISLGSKQRNRPLCRFIISKHPAISSLKVINPPEWIFGMESAHERKTLADIFHPVDPFPHRLQSKASR
jgi:hypothetical protein